MEIVKLNDAITNPATKHLIERATRDMTLGAIVAAMQDAPACRDKIWQAMWNGTNGATSMTTRGTTWDQIRNVIGRG